MLREMEDLRTLSIGSPVPTPRTDDDDGDCQDVFASAFDAETFPAIKIERCSTSTPIDVDDDRGSSGKQSGKRADNRNGRPPAASREEAATTRAVGAGGSRPAPASGPAKSGQRCD